MSILDEITAAVDKLRGQELPKAVVLRSAEDAERLRLTFPNSKLLAGLKVLVDPSIPEDTAYIIIGTPPKIRDRKLLFLFPRLSSIVKASDAY